MPADLRCRACGSPLTDTVVDLGFSPPSNAYLTRTQLDRMEPTFPLHVYVCRSCFLVQVAQYSAREDLFTADYAYFSSFSDSWLAHARHFAAAAIERLQLSTDSRVVEVASNDGYLLQYIVERGIQALGIEPARDAARAARARGVPTREFFLGARSAVEFVAEVGTADLVVANNVLAHVPDLHDFVAGLRLLIGERGTLSIEFPHVLELLRLTQFDTIYHEHFSYFSLLSLEPVLARHGLCVVDVEKLSTHGGSLRTWIRVAPPECSGPAVLGVRAEERAFGLHQLSTYADLAGRVRVIKRRFLRFLVNAVDSGKRVGAYGAAAKGNTLLNYCGVGPDLIEFVADRNPHKAGRWMPGSHIPIVDPVEVAERHPDYLVILPWNIQDEIVEQMQAYRAAGGRFVVAIPEVRELS